MAQKRDPDEPTMSRQPPMISLRVLLAAASRLGPIRRRGAYRVPFALYSARAQRLIRARH